MVDYGMQPMEVLKSATSINAKIFHLTNLGKLQKGFLADIIAVKGNQTKDITNMRNVPFVMKDGHIFKNGTLNAVEGQ